MGKPIIFLEPLSPNLKKLKDTISSDEAYSIYELEDPAEYKQLIATIGASLTVCSELKKMAKVLSDNKAIHKKNNNKSLLLSGEKLAYSITDKIQKLGLTEILYEPIVPKTLLYKVSLLCKSLKNVEAKTGDEEVVIKSLKQEKNDDETKLDKEQKKKQEEEEVRAKKERNQLKDEKSNKKSVNLNIEDDTERKKQKYTIFIKKIKS